MVDAVHCENIDTDKISERVSKKSEQLSKTTQYQPNNKWYIVLKNKQTSGTDTRRRKNEFLCETRA